jgi:hypothetical protein
MSDIALSEERLKILLKAAVVEALEERRELLRELIEETLEDHAMVRAIEEGAGSKVVDAAEVYGILQSKP